MRTILQDLAGNIISIDESPDHFSESKSGLLAALANIRWQKTQTFTYDGVLTVADSAISPLTAKVVAMQMVDPNGTATWKLAAGEFRTWTLAQLVTYGTAINAHIQACFDNEAAISAQIEAATTLEELAAINLNAGWP